MFNKIGVICCDGGVSSDSRSRRIVEEFGSLMSKPAESQCFGTGTSRTSFGLRSSKGDGDPPLHGNRAEFVTRGRGQNQMPP